jgi:hypothetical protein
MCPICYLRRLFLPAKPYSGNHHLPPIDNQVRRTPLMGWSSWNTFRNNIDERLILDTAEAMRAKGLWEAGYRYVNLDDNWHSSERTEDGRIQGDPQRFPRGMAALADDLNALGFKMGLYSSNGTLTCEDLPASLHRETLDAQTFADMGAEYLKYDYCHHELLSRYAPLVYGIELSDGKGFSAFYDCAKARLGGLAKRMPDAKVAGGYHVAGLDRNAGYMEYDLTVPQEGDYLLTVCIRKKGSKYRKCIAALANDRDIAIYDIPDQRWYNYTARFQKTLHLGAGQNTVRLFNPIAKNADSAFLQYYTMAKALLAASHNREGAHRPILFSICEWGRNQPYRWGAFAGNMWRTTPDIRPIFPWIKLIYGHNVKLYPYAKAGAFNDPDMLEVGNGKLTPNQNVAHFSLWCMMSAPLVLGNDLRKITDNVLSIVTNADMIAIDQDPLCKQCKRLKRGTVDLLAKPLEGGRTAICLFNRAKRTVKYTLNLDAVLSDPYIDRPHKAHYSLKDVWLKETFEAQSVIKTSIEPECVKVFIVQ